MNAPSILIGCLTAALLGSLAHLILGGGLGRLLLFLLVAQAGFWAGQIIAEAMEWNLINIGLFHADAVFLGCLGFLLLAHWLSLPEGKRKPF